MKLTLTFLLRSTHEVRYDNLGIMQILQLNEISGGKIPPPTTSIAGSNTCPRGRLPCANDLRDENVFAVVVCSATSRVISYMLSRVLCRTIRFTAMGRARNSRPETKRGQQRPLFNALTSRRKPYGSRASTPGRRRFRRTSDFLHPQPSRGCVRANRVFGYQLKTVRHLNVIIFEKREFYTKKKKEEKKEISSRSRNATSDVACLYREHDGRPELSGPA